MTEGASQTDQPAPAPAPAPASAPVPVPVPESAPELATAPTSYQRFIAGPFWAGLLGGGVLYWLVGVILALHDTGSLPRIGGDKVVRWIFLVAVPIATTAALTAGYRTPV